MDALSDYDFTLPEELIAREPAARRDEARLLVVDRARNELREHLIRDLPELLRTGDCLVLNDTQVLPARLLGRRVSTGGKWEGLYLGTAEDGVWRLIGQTRGRLLQGEQIAIEPIHGNGGGDLRLTLLERETDGVWRAVPDSHAGPLELLHAYGTMPLPPYLGRKVATDADWQRYQTVYSRSPGAVAAPTAGLHFTPELLHDCERRGVSRAFVTLHVGIGTFRPIAAERLSEHRMHAEWCELPAESAALLRRTRTAGNRIVAVGTTSVRTLESVAVACGGMAAWSGETDLFIRPPYEFQAVDALLTNFHLPRSSLLVMVSALAGIDLIRRAYEFAIDRRYRFFSYGDAMLIL